MEKIKAACEQSLVVNQIAAEIVHVTEERVYISSSPSWTLLHVCTYVLSGHLSTISGNLCGMVSIFSISIDTFTLLAMLIPYLHTYLTSVFCSISYGCAKPFCASDMYLCMYLCSKTCISDETRAS